LKAVEALINALAGSRVERAGDVSRGGLQLAYDQPEAARRNAQDLAARRLNSEYITDTAQHRPEDVKITGMVKVLSILLCGII
jgi:hypothetical protein